MRSRIIVVLWCAFVALFFGAGCSGCEADRLLDNATAAERRDDHVTAARTYAELCQRFPSSGACEKARAALPNARIAAAKQLLERNDFKEAKEMLDAAVAGGGEAAERAKTMLKSPDLAAGLRFEAAREGAEGDLRQLTEALKTIEELAESKTTSGPLARRWLDQKGARYYFALASEACARKPPANECGDYLSRIIERHPNSKEAKDAAPLLKSYAKVPFDEAQQLEWQGKLGEAAKRYDEVCRRGPATDLCKTANERSGSLRVRAATTAMSSLAFNDAKALLDDVVSRCRVDWIKRQAQTMLDSDEMKSGLTLDRARGKQTSDRRSALADMEEVAKANTRAGWAAKAWITKERPSLYLEDANAACKPSSDQCPVKAKLLMTAHPGTAEATAARKLLTDWESEPIAAAEQFAKEGKLLEAATEYERACARAPESSACARAAPLALDTRTRGAQEAMAAGRYIDAKKAFETLILGAKDEAKKAQLRAIIDTPDFLAGLAKEQRASALATTRTSCTSGADDCRQLVGAVMKSGDAGDSEEAKKLLADYERLKSTSDVALAKAETVLAKCSALSKAESLQSACFPGRFSATTTLPSDSPIDRLALAAGYASGADGVPRPGIALRGLVLLGAILGIAAGLAIQLARGGKGLAAIIVTAAAVAVITGAIIFSGAFAKTQSRYATVGLHES